MPKKIYTGWLFDISFKSLLISRFSQPLSFFFSIYLMKQGHLSHRVFLICILLKAPHSVVSHVPPSSVWSTDCCLASRGSGVAIHQKARNVCFSLFLSYPEQFMPTAWAHSSLGLPNGNIQSHHSPSFISWTTSAKRNVPSSTIWLPWGIVCRHKTGLSACFFPSISQFSE